MWRPEGAIDLRGQMHEDINMINIVKKTVIIGVLLFGITRIIDYADMRHDKWLDQKEEAEDQADLDEAVRVIFQVSNADKIEGESTVLIVNPENVVAAYLDVYGDGRINADGLLLHPDEDYRMLVNYNETKELREFHTGVNDGHYYILTYDYATGELDQGMVPEQEVLDSGDYKYYVNDDGTVTLSGWNEVSENVVVPEEIDGRKVTALGNWLFSYCKGMKSVELPKSLTTIGDRAFEGCEGLESIELPDSLISLGDEAFEGCSSLTSVRLPDSLTAIGDSAFEGCSSLTSVRLPDSLTAIGNNVFDGCGKLADIELPESLVTIGVEAFENCDSLTSVVIPDGVTEIGDFAFSGCGGLTSVKLPESLTTVGRNPFSCCRKLTRIEISPDQETFGVDGDVLFNRNDKTLVCYPIGLAQSGYVIPEGTQTIGYGAFQWCANLTSIEIPETVTTIEAWAFEECDGLTSVEIPGSVTTIGEMAFKNCDTLKSIKVPGSVTSIGEEALSSYSDPTLIVERDSYAEKYAVENEIPYTYAEE